MKNNFWVVLIFLLLACGNDKIEVEASSERGFDKARIENYNHSERYNYDKEIVRKPNPILNVFGDILSGIAWFLNTIFGYIVIIILIGLLIYVLFKYVNTERFTYENEATQLRMVDESTISDIDLDKLLKNAIAKQDYRLAIRFNFLKALKTLSWGKLILMKEGKTNFDYYRELPEKLKPTYKQILSVFEYVWYGEFPADEALYSQAASQTNELKSLINRTDV